MVKFDEPSDREHVISGGPWMVYDHYLAVTPWSRDFLSPEARVYKTLVWIRFPGLSLAYYDEDLLNILGSTVGEPIKIDLNTKDCLRGRYARMCVSIDLDAPVVGKILLNDHWQPVAYEGLHLICKSCGKYGHILRNCNAR